ncbi:MAG: hypothetical protein FJX64_01425 [Alphaproteobacteria bacterium]|nr:hypothetical protein [Alphaproteobacteria bacterium]
MKLPHLLHSMLPAAMPDVSRRTFLIAGTAASGAFLVGTGTLPLGEARSRAATDLPQRLNAWLEIAPSGTVTVARVEMGQGTYTSLAMLPVEELDFPWANVKVAAAPRPMSPPRRRRWRRKSPAARCSSCGRARRTCSTAGTAPPSWRACMPASMRSGGWWRGRRASPPAR